MTNNKKNVIWNILGATTNAFNSLLFTIVVTRINGIDDAGTFTYCFATACLLYMIGVYAGRTFQVTDISKKNTDTDYIYHRVITCTIMMIAAIGFTMIKGYDIYKASILIILCGFKCIEAFAESLYGVIQKNNCLYKVGKSMFLKAILSIIVFMVTNMLTKNLLLSSLTIVIVNIIVILIYDIKNVKKIGITKSKYTRETNRRLLKIGFFTFILTFLGTYLINAPRYAIDDLLENNLQTIFGIIIMPATLMGLLGQYIIQPALINIAENIEKEKYRELKKIIYTLISIISILGIIVIGVAYLVETPVLEFIYGIQLDIYFESMIIIVIGSILYSLGTVLSAVLIAMRKTVIQAIIYFITAVLSTGIAYSLIRAMELKGASITYFITMLIIAISFSICTIINMKKYKEKWRKIGE